MWDEFIRKFPQCDGCEYLGFILDNMGPLTITMVCKKKGECKRVIDNTISDTRPV